MYFANRYAMFLALVIPALEIEEIKTGTGKFLDAAILAVNEPTVGPAIDESTDPVADQVRQYVQYVYHGGPKPRWVAFSEM